MRRRYEMLAAINKQSVTAEMQCFAAHEWSVSDLLNGSTSTLECRVQDMLHPYWEAAIALFSVNMR